MLSVLLRKQCAMARSMLGTKSLFLLEMMKMITAPTWSRYCSCLHARKAHRDAALIIEMLYQGYYHIENSSISKSRRRKREKPWCFMKEKERWPLIETRAMFNFNRTSTVYARWWLWRYQSRAEFGTMEGLTWWQKEISSEHSLYHEAVTNYLIFEYISWFRPSISKKIALRA